MDYTRACNEPLLTLDVDHVTLAELNVAFSKLSIQLQSELKVGLQDDEQNIVFDKDGVYNLRSNTNYNVTLKTKDEFEAIQLTRKRIQQDLNTATCNSYAKRDYYRKIETRMQQRWQDEKIFELDAPIDGTDNSECYMATFPYPYMNGRLHLGHTFSLLKSDFSVNYQRMKGKRAIFPFGFHCTGMPIKTSADKLIEESKTFGFPPKFPEKSVSGNIKIYFNAQQDDRVFKSKKSKATSKSSTQLWQWQIMRDLGFNDDEILKFVNVEHWVNLFPNYAIEDLKLLGSCIDWRRSFVTTSLNPYYDSFVRWQFLKLKKQGKILYGKRNTIYSPKDQGPCLDHDRQVGEAVLPLEFLLIKQRLLKPYPEKLKHLEASEKSIYLVPATLRPETLYSQTNCWVLPSGEYGLFEVKNNEIFICTDRAMRNMSYQNITAEWGVVSKIMTIQGIDLIGSKVNAPNSKYENVHVLPMFTITMNKGTGVVTGVTSDSIEDYVAWCELVKKPNLRAKYALTEEMVLPFEPVPIIDVPGLGVLSAKACVEKFAIKSQNDRVSIERAKEYYNKLSFSGIYAAGPYVGKASEAFKPVISKEMISQSLALEYAEPASEVISRSGEECVVALVAQWYINYSDPEWRAQAKQCLAQMELYGDDVKQAFDKAIDWINSWACSRTYGLGTKIPWDEQSLIDSLSDSSIYPAYYTVSHYLHSDLKGAIPGPAGIAATDMTFDIWEYIFCGVPLPSNSSVSDESLKAMRNEFLYWYPVDLRVSGKDLVNNHLLFFLYNHVAIFGREHWPRSFHVNGHVLLNKSKMSKSTGNFVTLQEGIERYTADGMRFSLADSGDSIADANFSTDSANSILLRLYSQIEWTRNVLGTTLRQGAYNFMDEIFENQLLLSVALTDSAYAKLEFKDAVKVGFYDLQNYRDVYQDIMRTEGSGMHRDLVHKFVRTQALLLAPICPHWSEYLWSELLGETQSILKSKIPTVEPYDSSKLDQYAYLVRNLHAWRVKVMKSRNRSRSINTAVATVQRSYVGWRGKCVEILKNAIDSSTDSEPLNYEKAFALIRREQVFAGRIKEAVSFVKDLLGLYFSKGCQVFHPELLWDEMQILISNQTYICKSINIENLTIREASPDDLDAIPGSPSLTLVP